MAHNLDDTFALLSRTPAALDALLRGLPESWTHRNNGGQTWNAFGIVGHLIHQEQDNWMPRAKMIRQVGESGTFASIDRTAHARITKGKSLPQLLDEFARARASNIKEVKSWKLTPQDLEKRGTHPAFGPVTLSQLLATWAAHDLTHLHQLSRVMAHQYREHVGPWIKYLGVLKCDAHGD